MKMYVSLFRIRLINGMQYRMVALGEIAMRLVWAMMEILVFLAIYRTGNAGLPMDFSQTVSYIWLQQGIRSLFLVVFQDGEIYSTIEKGSIAYELVRPANLYGRWFCQSAANRLAYTLLNGVPSLFLAMLFPQPYRMKRPTDAGVYLLFLISLLSALLVVVAFAMLMYISLFYTLAQRGVRLIVTAVSTFLSGGVIPLAFFPEKVLKAVKLLPFASMQDTPLRIYNGSLAGAEAVKGIALQIFWIAALVGIGQIFMSRALKKVVVQGG